MLPFRCVPVALFFDYHVRARPDTVFVEIELSVVCWIVIDNEAVFATAFDQDFLLIAFEKFHADGHFTEAVVVEQVGVQRGNFVDYFSV